MGFTVYWESKPVSEDVFAKFITMAKSVVRPSVEVEVMPATLAFNPPEDRGETFYVTKGDSGFHYCKTYRELYTADVLRCLILMVELGMAFDVRADDDLGYLKELNHVHSVYPLQTYNDQKEYYKSIIEIC
jgi:hypothetical protein